MKKIFPLLLCFTIIINFTIFKTETNAQNETHEIVINENNVNIRVAPNLNSSILKQATKGEVYKVISAEDEWFEVKLDNGKIGWVASWVVTESITNKINDKPNTYLGIITTDDLRVRAGPSVEDKVTTHLQSNEVVQVIESKNEWVKVTGHFGTGWIISKFVKLHKQTAGSSPSLNHGVVTTDILNIRETDSEQAKVIGKLQKNTEITIVAEKNDWFEIVFGQSTGWVNSLYVKKIPNSNFNHSEINEELSNEFNGYVGRVTASKLNVRKKSSFNAKKIDTISSGTIVEIIDEKPNWIKVVYDEGKQGWITSLFVERLTEKPYKNIKRRLFRKNYVTILHDQTNIREKAKSNSDIIKQVESGEQFEIIDQHGNWYEIKLTKKKSGFVAGWLVNTKGITNTIQKQGPEQYLKNKVVIIDPGHGGYDQGTAGSLGNTEKQLTLKTAHHVANQLREAGAQVILTRTTDTYVSLPTRTSMSNLHNADAFISIHFDSTEDTSINGMTTYFYYDFQKGLANNIHSSIVNSTKLKNREVQHGDYYVLRENYNDAILLELGFLSNPTEETYIATDRFQTIVANSIYKGLAKHFK